MVSLSDSIKSMGATLDSTLRLDKQVAATCRSAWFHLHKISRIKHYLTIQQLKTVIHAYVIGRVDQNNSLLLGLPQTLLKKVQMVQNSAARLILNGNKRDHITPLLKELHWLPVEKRILFKVLLLIYKSMHGKGPLYLQELLVPYVPNANLRSANQQLLCVPKRHHADTRKRDFAHRGPSEWNNLPLNIRESDNVNQFKTALKTYLFRKAYL